MDQKIPHPVEDSDPEDKPLSPLRRRALGGIGASAALAAGGGWLSGCASPAGGADVPRSGEFVIRNAIVVSMDPTIGDLPRADVHVRDGAIVAVGVSITAPGAESVDGAGMIVMPGFIDTHWHLWNTIQKNMLSKGVEYFPLKAALVQHYTAEDFYRSNRLALAEAVNGGFTTVNNFAHNTRSPAHVDAEIRAMAESGLRGRYSYGWIDPIPDKQVANLEDIARVKRQWFGADSPMRGRIDMGMALRGPMYTPFDVYAAEFRAARSMGLPAILHVGQTKRRYAEVAKLHAEGFIDRSTILVHGIVATAADRQAMAQSGASLSISPQSEMRDQEDGDFREQLLQMMAAKINICLSIDSSVLGAASMFDQMSAVWYLGIPWRGTPSEKLPYVDFGYVLSMATINGARAMGIADKTGSLTPGKRADMLMIRATDLNMVPLGNVRTALVRSAQNHNIDSVIVDGVFRKRGGRILGLDIEQVKREASQALFDVRTRAGGKWAPPAGS